MGGLAAPAGRTCPFSTIGASDTSTTLAAPFAVVGGAVIGSGGVVTNVDAVLPDCAIEGGLLEAAGLGEAGIGERMGACATPAG